MLKWIVVVALAAVLLGLAAPQLSRLGVGRLPGDLRFKRNGREYYLPVTSTILLSIAATLIGRVIRL